MIRSLFILSVAVVALGACRGSIAGGSSGKCQRYIQWFDDPANGMTQVKTQGPVAMSCRLSNSNYEQIVTASNQAGCDELMKALHQKSRKEKPSLNFILKLNDESGELKTNLDRSADLVKYLQAQMGADFALLHQGDTLKPVFYHFENNLDIAPQVCFIIGFDAPQKQAGDLTLLFRDKILTFQTQLFVFKSEHIKRIPKI